LFKQKSEINSKINKISQDMHIFDYDINDINMSLNNAKIMISTNQSKLSQIEQNLIFLNIDKDNMKLLDVSLEEINSDLRKTKRDKNSLGNINFNAIESYDKLAKEYDEIKSKCEILEKEKEQVLSMLNEINLKKETVFMDCFNKISKEFKNNVKNMSKFLSGELELVGDDILTSKLTINLTKNNKTKELDIMSGGEKTVTALAFIFSLHSYKNAPFYILDEVDAALDDYNSLSLLNFVKNISKYTIILSISHNSTMVSGADQIIGVTLKENTSIIGLNINK
jgi:chromosome segregation protein